jgi:oligosaccharide repeat unit polymerase
MILFIAINYSNEAIEFYGIINTTTFFILFFVTAVITLLPRCFDENYVTGPHSAWYQTLELFEEVAQVSLLALASMYLGWLLAKGALPAAKQKARVFNMRANEIFFWLSISIGFIVGIFFLPTSNMFYETRTEILAKYADSGLRSGNAIVLFSTTMAYFAYLKKPSNLKKYVFFVLFLYGFVFCGFLTGSRVEQVGALVSLIMAYQWDRKKQLSKKTIYFFGVIIFLVLSLIGFIRTGNQGLTSAGALEYFESFQFAYTQKDIMTTAIVVLGLEKDGVLNIDYGKTFLDILRSTFPKKFDEDRPDQFDSKISQMTEWPGGSFIINEPYISGGYLGVALSFVFVGWAFRKLEVIKYGKYGSVVYLGVMTSVPRFVYYGWFPAYRFLTIAFLFCLVYWLINSFLPSKENVGEK